MNWFDYLAGDLAEVGDAALHYGSGALAEVPAAAVQLGMLARGEKPAVAREIAGELQDRLTWDPKTEQGQAYVDTIDEAAGALFDPIAPAVAGAVGGAQDLVGEGAVDALMAGAILLPGRQPLIDPNLPPGKKNVLVAAEESGRVRDALNRRGHHAVSADLEYDSRTPGPHYKGDVRDILHEDWDMMCAFPPCTALTRSSAWRYEGTKEQKEALDFVRELLEADIPQIALENPAGKISTAIRKPDQFVDPYLFGDPYTKHTGLWLKNLDPLEPTNIVDPYLNGYILNMPGKGAARAKARSLTPYGLAEAMAEQWGNQPLTADMIDPLHQLDLFQ